MANMFCITLPTISKSIKSVCLSKESTLSKFAVSFFPFRSKQKELVKEVCHEL
jgi:hypothetical protein